MGSIIDKATDFFEDVVDFVFDLVEDVIGWLNPCGLVLCRITGVTKDGVGDTIGHVLASAP